MANQLMKLLTEVSSSHPEYVSNLRGAGTVIAFDCNSSAMRDQLANTLRNNGVLVGTNGTQSIRFRPALNFSTEHVEEFCGVFEQTLAQLAHDQKS